MDSIEQIFRRLERRAANIQLVAMKRGEAEMKLRIFDEGRSTNGASLGNYRSESHKRKRVRRGRQIASKDLELEGDLRRSITTGQQDGKAVLGITTNRQRIIAEGQERQIGREVFSLSDAAKDAIFATIRQEAKRTINAR